MPKLGISLEVGRSATSSGSPSGGGGLVNAYSVDFDGADDYVDIGASGSLGSVSLWFKPDVEISDSSVAKAVVGFTGVSPWGAYGSIQFGGNTSSDVDDEIITIYTGDWVYAYASTSATISTDWHHLAIRWTGSDYEIYLDGTQVKNTDGQSGSGSKANIAISAFSIGRRNNNSRFFAGLLDEVAIWTSPLSATDVVAIYNSGTPADLTDYSPVGWWRMGDNDGGTGTTITDQGSGSNDGTLTNGPAFSSDVPSA